MTWNNHQTITPMELHFEGKTDEEGKLYINFTEKEKYEKTFTEKYETGLVNCSISCDTIFNVRDNFEQIDFTDKAGIKNPAYLPENKIATFNDLGRVFNQLRIDCKTVVRKVNFLNGKLYISSRVRL